MRHAQSDCDREQAQGDDNARIKNPHFNKIDDDQQW